MENKNLIEKQNVGFFSKIKNWFKGLFGSNQQKNEVQQDLEFEKQANVQNDEVFQEYEENEQKLKYEFSSPTVSKQKIDKIRLDLDNGKAGIEDLYQLSNEELEELSKAYDTQINDTVSKLNEIEVSINGYKRRLSKIQG